LSVVPGGKDWSCAASTEGLAVGNIEDNDDLRVDDYFEKDCYLSDHLGEDNYYLSDQSGSSLLSSVLQPEQSSQNSRAVIENTGIFETLGFLNGIIL
jgi:hypothetical protein